MKVLFTLSTVLLLAACSSSKLALTIPANQQVAVAIPTNKSVNVDLKNKSLKDVEVKVVKPNSGEFVSGFGLAPTGKATVFVEKGNILQLKNTTNSKSKITYTYQAISTQSTSSVPLATNKKQSISFKLANNSAKSIPLIIPSVMNPNLSPFSKSGVDLKVGQKIFFKKGMKRYLLLEVTEDIQDGAIIKVDKLLKERKKALGV